MATVPATATSDPVPLVDGQPLCGVVGEGEPAVLPEGSSLTVGTYNILHSQGEHDAANLTLRRPQIVQAMLAADADVWGLQEVTNNSEHGRIAELIAKELAARTGQRWEWCWFLSNPHFPGEPDVQEGGGGPLSEAIAQQSNFPEAGDFREGLGIVTRFDIVDQRSRRLTARAYEAPLCIPPDPLGCNLPAVFDSRQVMWARIDTGPTTGEFDFFNTHLAHPLTEASDLTRRTQIEVALAIIDEWATPGDPDFFVGDFNTRAVDDPDAPFASDADRYRRVLDAGFVDTYAESGAVECGTHPTQDWRGCTSDQPLLTDTREPAVTKRIDFVFARSESCSLSVGASEIIGTTAKHQSDGRWLWPSDHFGVVSTVSDACPPS
jgi:endonuclease/exonuclease/phosphatase family metal-dependent hydrolase